MQLSVTFRHMDASEAVKQHTIDKIQRIKKFFPDPIRAQVVLSTERYRHQADVNITLHNGISIKGKEVTEDMYAAIDLVMDKIERQVRRYKDKISSHRPHSGPELLVHHEVLERVAEPDQAPSSPPADLRIVRSSKFFAKSMTPEEAIMQMNLIGNGFLVFTNADTLDVNVVYKRADDNYGLIETGRSAEDHGSQPPAGGSTPE
jgi:ribosome hibernation promoting factor